MTFFIPNFKKFRDKKPLDTVEINYNSEFSKDLNICCPFINGSLKNLVDNNREFVVNTGGYQTSNDGIIVGSSQYENITSTDPNPSDITPLSLITEVRQLSYVGTVAGMISLEHTSGTAVEIARYSNKIQTYLYVIGSSWTTVSTDVSSYHALALTDVQDTVDTDKLRLYRGGEQLLGPYNHYTRDYKYITLGNRTRYSWSNAYAKSEFRYFYLYKDQKSPEFIKALYESPYQFLKQRPVWFFLPAANGPGGDSTGSLSAVESGADIASASSSVEVSGSIAGVDSAQDSSALLGDVIVAGAISAAEQNRDSLAASGTVIDGIAGVLAATETGVDSAALSATTEVSGDFDLAEAGFDSAALTGDIIVSGAFSATESGMDAVSASGTVVDGRVAIVNIVEPSIDSAELAGLVGVSGDILALESGRDVSVLSGTVESARVGSVSVAETGLDAFLAECRLFISGAVSAIESGVDSVNFDARDNSQAAAIDSIYTVSARARHYQIDAKSRNYTVN